MDSTIIKIIKDELRVMKASERGLLRRADELSGYEDKILIPCVKGNGRIYNYYRDRGEKGRHYLGNNTNEEVQKIKEARLLHSTLEAVANNIDLLENVVNGYQDTSYECINGKLPKTYQGAVSPGLIDSSLGDERIATWIAKCKNAKAEYLKRFPDKHPESLRVQRANGEYVRSKSEDSIMTLLEKNGLVCLYEIPHYCAGVWIKTDVTVLSPIDYVSELFIEHAGRMDLPEYQNKFLFTLVHYMQSGRKPNIDLFYTFDNLDDTFSLVPLQKFIDDWILR